MKKKSGLNLTKKHFREACKKRSLSLLDMSRYLWFDLELKDPISLVNPILLAVFQVGSEADR